MYFALDVSRYVIDYSHKKGQGVSNLKLQKLLYFIQAEFLIETGKRCFSDEIYAWDFGPVVPTVYREYVMYGACHINCGWTKESKEKTERSCRIIKDKDKEIINRVIDRFADYSATQLVSLTLKERPWKEAYIPHLQKIIPSESIKEYFSGGKTG